MKVQSDRSEQIARRAQTLDHRWPVNFQHLLDWKLPVCYGQSPSKIIVIVLFKWGWLPLLSNYQRWFRWVRSFPWAHRPRDKRQQVWQRPRLLASLLFPSLALAAKHVADRSSVDPSDWGISLQPYGYNQLASKITDWIQNLATTVVSCDVKILSMIAPVCVAKTTPSETMSATSTQACCLQSWKRESSFQRNTWFCWEMEVPKMEDPKKNIRIIGRYFDGFPQMFWGNPIFGSSETVWNHGPARLPAPRLSILPCSSNEPDAGQALQKTPWKLEHPSSYGNKSHLSWRWLQFRNPNDMVAWLPQLELDLHAQWWRGLKPMIKLLEFMFILHGLCLECAVWV